ncbi:MAG: cyclic nucleotide-binding domain-containing protein [Nocardioides sp.]
MARERAPDSRSEVLRRALRNGRLRRVLVAYVAFNVQEWATWIALLVWAHDLGGVRGASAIALAQLVPSAVLASPAAVLLDRLPRTRALPLGYALQSVAQLALAAALLLGLPVAAVVSAAVVSAVAITLTRPAHHALLPEISDTTGELTVGNTASGTAEAAATFAGPLVCGALLAVWVPGGVALVMGVAMAGAALVTSRALVRHDVVAPLAAGPAAARGRARAALRDPDARLMCALAGSVNVLVGMTDILLVVLALDLLGMSDAGLGLLNSALGVGGLVGAATSVVLVGRQRLAPALMVASAAAGASLTAAGLVPLEVAAFALLALSGAGKSFFDIACRTLVQRLLPDRMLAAVFGLQEALMMAGLAVGTLVAPLLVELAGPRVAFVVAGLFLPVSVLLLSSRLRRVDARTTVPADVLALLLQVPILAVLAPRLVERLALEAVRVEQPARTALVREGEPGAEFFVVGSGRVAVSHGDELVRELGPGGWFGELALLRDGPRTATVTALTPVVLWSVARDPFLASVGRAPQSLQAVDEHARDHYR